MQGIAWRASAIGALFVSVCGSARAIDRDIHNYVCSKLNDFTATMTVVKADQRELGKISRDFGLLYRFKDVQMRYKEPNKVRIEGSAEGATGIFVFSGSTQWVSIPKLRIKTKSNYGDSPGKRKSLMDVGLISDFYLTYTNAQFVREGTVEGTPVAVFDMTYKNRSEDTSHQRIYIDPKTKVVRMREAYSQAGKLQAIYYYREVKEVQPGIWFPTEIEAQNTDHVIAGITAYKDIRVNTGLSDSLFQM